MAFDANDLSPHEQFVLDRTRDGDVADFSAMGGPGKPQVRAGFLRKLMLGLDAGWPVRTPGVRLKGVRVEGALDLTDCTGAGGAGLPALALIACDIPETIDLSHARLARVSLHGSQLRALIADETAIDGELDLRAITPLSGDPGTETLLVRARGARIDGDVALSGAKLARAAEADDDALFLQGAEIIGNLMIDDGFDALGCVWLAGAHIHGRIQADGAQLLNRSDNAEGHALVLNDARVGGSVCLRDKFKAEGQVNALSARIGGDVDLSGGSFRNDGGPALIFGNAEIGGQVLGAAKIAGQIVLQGASIARNLDLRGVELTHAVSGREKFGRAIDAPNLRVGGAVLLHGANVKGEIFLPDARVDGYLAFGGGRFLNAGGWAIRAPNMRVGGNVTFKIADSGYAPHGQKTVIEGGAKFERAQIDGALAWVNLELRGPGPEGAKGALLSFADVHVRGAVQAKQLTMQADGAIDLSGASCASLEDDLKSGWGAEAASLDLDGFSYGRIESNAKDDRWRQRLAWVRRAPRFSPQPYAALADVYARAGQREDARHVLLAQHDQRTLHASAGPLTWLFSSAFGLIAGYGFAPLRIVRALALFLVIGVAGVLAMDAQGALVTQSGARCGGTIEPALYAVDVALPIIDLGQQSLCAPGRAPGAELFAGMQLGETQWRAFEGAAAWRWAHALYAIFGAILAALAVLTFSGALKPKSED
ncbi:membrane-associated oxidoreductase [alpha proteobacterium U9-1i]|nr:membrane-associated oxidoreductase [alpha proteobacterium U9-1i]